MRFSIAKLRFSMEYKFVITSEIQEKIVLSSYLTHEESISEEQNAFSLITSQISCSCSQGAGCGSPRIKRALCLDSMGGPSWKSDI